MTSEQKANHDKKTSKPKQRCVPELYQVVIECRNEAEQQEVFERMRAEGRKVRLHVL